MQYQHNYNVKTTPRRRFDVMTLLSRHVSVRIAYPRERGAVSYTSSKVKDANYTHYEMNSIFAYPFPIFNNRIIEIWE